MGSLLGARAKHLKKRNHKKERQPASYSFFPDGWLSFFLVVSFTWLLVVRARAPNQT